MNKKRQGPKQNHKFNADFLIAFGQHVRKLREQKEMSMRAFADHVEIEYSTLAAIENGRTNTTLSTAMAIAEALNISHHDLFDFKYPIKGKKEK